MDGDFAVIEKPEQAVQAGGRTFTVRPLTIGQLPAFAKHVRPLAGSIEKLMQTSGTDKDSMVALLLDLVAEHGDSLLEAAAVALRVKRDEIESLDPLEFVSLMLPIVRINADFFSRRLHPALAQALSAGQRAHGDGQTPSRP